MRRVLVYRGLITALLCTSLAVTGCGKGDSSGKKDNKASVQSESAETTAESRDESKEAASEEKNKDTADAKEQESSAALESLAEDGPWFEKGEWIGDTYINRQAGISIKLPEGWTAFTDEELMQVMNAGYDQLTDVQKKQYELNMKNQLSVYDMGAAGDDGQSSFFFMVENVGKSPITARMGEAAYLEIVGNQLKKTALSYEVDDIEELEIAGDTWNVMAVRAMGMTQWYISHKNEQRMQSFILSVPDTKEDSLDELLSCITALEE